MANHPDYRCGCWYAEDEHLTAEQRATLDDKDRIKARGDIVRAKNVALREEGHRCMMYEAVDPPRLLWCNKTPCAGRVGCGLPF